MATLRNARGGAHPDLLRAADAALSAGADGITMHLREDRRHIRDRDVFAVKAHSPLPLNFEMAATAEMMQIAHELQPGACCIVPEKREELTTEGGLDVAGQGPHLKNYIERLKKCGARISLFIDADKTQLDAAKAVGADIVELHTGTYCDAGAEQRPALLTQLQQAATYGVSIGLEIHAGHGLSYDTAGPVAAIPELTELNIGHFLIGEALYCGLEQAIRKMRDTMDKARA